MSENNARHWKNKKFSDEHKKKISENNARYWQGKPRSKETRKKISEVHNTTGFYRVCKEKNNTCKQGFVWRYKYQYKSTRKQISSVNLLKLKEKIESKACHGK